MREVWSVHKNIINEESLKIIKKVNKPSNTNLSKKLNVNVHHKQNK